jgi:hypothetical protein
MNAIQSILASLASIFDNSPPTFQPLRDDEALASDIEAVMKDMRTVHKRIAESLKKGKTSVS